jgi:hypothetical protein
MLGGCNMYYVADIAEDWYIKGSYDHYEMSYTGDFDTAFRTQNKDTAFQVSDKCNENGMETKVIIVDDKFKHITVTK